MGAAASLPSGRLAELRAASLEAAKRRGELARWAQGAGPLERAAADVVQGIAFAAAFLLSGRFGPHGLCLHRRRTHEPCAECDAWAARARDVSGELELEELEAERRRRMLEELGRWAAAYRGISDRELGRALAEGLELARGYVLTGRLEVLGEAADR